jgi:hypothetical protein
MTVKFFIVGCPRSGTTMLQQALGRHSQIAIPPETAFFTIPRFSTRGRREHLQRLNEDLGIALPHNPSTATAGAARALYEEMTRLYLTHLGKVGVTHFGEKTPVHLSRLRQIRQVFPDARAICIYRDGRDVALSLLSLPWTSRDLYVNFALWRYCCRLQRQLQRAAELPVHFVRYEDLVAGPERELRAITAFLGLPYEARLTDASIDAGGVPPWESQWKARANEPIHPGRLGLWRDRLSEAQLGVLERWGGNDLRELGYELATDGRHPLPWFFRARVAVRGLLWLARRPGYGQHKSLWLASQKGPDAEAGHAGRRGPLAR